MELSPEEIEEILDDVSLTRTWAHIHLSNGHGKELVQAVLNDLWCATIPHHEAHFHIIIMRSASDKVIS